MRLTPLYRLLTFVVIHQYEVRFAEQTLASDVRTVVNAIGHIRVTQIMLKCVGSITDGHFTRINGGIADGMVDS